MKTLLLVSTAVLALAATELRAADYGVRGPVRSPVAERTEVFDWTGWYAGASIGLATGNSKHVSSFGDLTPSFDVNGGVFGLGTGYNWQTGPTVFGFDGDISISTKHGQSGFTANPALRAETSERWLATYRGRIGLAWDSWMIYATGGGAAADVKATSNEAIIASETKTRFGWTVGGGIEAARIHSFSVKAEYLYVNFDNPSYLSPAPAGITDRAGGVKLDNHIFRIGLNHKIPGF